MYKYHPRPYPRLPQLPYFYRIKNNKRKSLSFLEFVITTIFLIGVLYVIRYPNKALKQDLDLKLLKIGLIFLVYFLFFLVMVASVYDFLRPYLIKFKPLSKPELWDPIFLDFIFSLGLISVGLIFLFMNKILNSHLKD